MKRLFEIVTFVLAIVAIGFAIKQYYDSRDLIATNRELNDKLANLLGTASTRYVDDFPDDISGIQEVLSGTCQELDIAVSVPGYAQYSSPRDFDRYKAALVAVAKSTIRENKQSKKCLGKKLAGNPGDDGAAHVKLLLLAPDLRKANLQDQVNKRFLAELNVSGSDGQRKFLNFFQANHRLISDQPETYLDKVLHGGVADFVDRLDKQHHVNEEEYCTEGIEIRYSKEPFALFLWLQDQQEAAFSFGGADKITFRTRDGKLIDGFKDIFRAEWDRGTPYDEYWQQVSVR